MNYAEDRLDRKARHSNEKTLQEAHEYLKKDEISEKVKGHELAGKTLRDAGLSPQATFHYGMAWLMTCCWNDEDVSKSCEEDLRDVGSREGKAVGDYAQMVELAGFPEVGVLSLLFHRLGGGALIDDRPFTDDHLDEKISDTENIFSDKHEDRTKRNCGCGMVACGASSCFVPSQMATSSLFQELLNSFQSLENYLKNPSFGESSNAASLLEAVSKATQKKNPVRVNPVTPPHIPIQLRFWEEASEHPTTRTIPHLLQILLMKLLYSAPIGSAFLYLACESIRHISISLPVSSKLGRKFAQTHKSHWAYYILVYKVVLGERIKKHRRGTAVPYHYPVWDIIHALDQRKFGKIQNSGRESSRLDRIDATDLATHLNALFQKLCQCYNYQDHLVKFAIPVGLPRVNSEKTIFAIGDSHVLSIAWQTLHINDGNHEMHRIVVPCPITGLKAWHTRKENHFFTKHNLESCLQRLPKSCRSIILSAGEIDCREGIGGTLLEGLYNDCNDAVRNTVKEYVDAVTFLAKQYDLQILLMPVAPHAYRSEKNGRAMGRGLRRQRMLLWNNTLREFCHFQKEGDDKQNIFLLDYEEGLRVENDESPVGFVLNKNFNADFTHMNSAFLPLLEKSIIESNCNCDLL